jgi:hypothetical protein
LIDKDSGVAAGWNPDVDGPVYCILPSGDNYSVFVAGAFASVGAVQRHGVAEINVYAGIATTWISPLDAGAVVRDALLSGTRLYLGGVFSITDGVTVLASNLVALNRSGGVTDWLPVIDAGVNTLLLSADQARLYIGGEFSEIDSASRQYLAALDPQAAVAGEYVQDWFADADDVVMALALSRDRTTLFAGGGFKRIAGVDRDRLVALRVADASVIDDGSWTVAANDSVNELLFSDDVLFVSGAFSTVNQQVRPALAALNALPVEMARPQTQASLIGGHYNSQELRPVELLCDDGQGSGCAVTYYSIDDGPWLLYGSPLIFTKDTDLRFFSIDHVGNSEDITINHEVYVLDVTAPKTTISPATRAYDTETLTLSLSCSDDISGCAGTYYTLDNTNPTASSRLYVGPFTIRGNVVVKYFSLDQVGNHEVFRRTSFVSSFGGGGVADKVLLLLVVSGLLLGVRATHRGGCHA